jgi:hypothetical protein
MLRTKRNHGRHGATVALAAVALMLSISITADAGSLIYQPDIPDQPANYVPPAVLVGFNPQPEPPARLIIAGDLGHPPDPGITFSGLEGDRTELLLGIGGGHQRLATMTLVGASCGLDSNLRLYPIFRDTAIPSECEGRFQVRARFTDRTVLDLDVSIRAARGGALLPPGQLISFNPQPEPPAIPAFGLRMDTARLGADSVTVDLTLSDRRGNIIPLR